MGSKSAAATTAAVLSPPVDNVVKERRLRPIYDSIDSGNNKKALQEADRVLKKHPNSLCAKVSINFAPITHLARICRSLKALAFIRLSRVEDAWSLIEEVEKQQPDEEYTLQALTYCFKDLVKPERIVSLYEGACCRSPQNEEYLTHLFMAYVRIRKYKNQQQTAQELFKLTKKPQYHLWAVMSALMQGMADPSRATSLYFPLAEGMLRRVINEEIFQTEDSIRLYLLILEVQKKYKETMAIIQGSLGEKYLRHMWNREYILMDHMKKVEDWKKVFEICCRRLPTNSNDWQLYMNMFESVFSVVRQTENTAGTKTELIQEATDLILDLIESDRDQTESVATRGPYIARLYWILNLLEKDLVVREELGEPENLLLEYFRLFSHKPSCFSDMKPYLCLLGEQQQDEANDIQRHVCCIQLRRCLGGHLAYNCETKLAYASRLFLRYKQAVNKREPQNCTEWQCCDEYLLLALHILWDVYIEQGDSGLLNEMVLLCKIGLNNNSSNCHLKFIATKTYALLGAGICVLTSADEIDLKHIQKDTLGYLVFDQLSPFGLYEQLGDWMLGLELFFANSEREAVESLVTAYKFNAFAKIAEIIDFNEKLQLSFHRISAEISRKYFWLITMCDSVQSFNRLKSSSCTNPYSESVEWTSLGDNRDFSSHPCWNPGNVEDERMEERKKSFQEMIDMIRFRHLVLRILVLLCEDKLMNGDMNNIEKNISSNHLITLLGQLKAHYRHVKASHCRSVSWSLQGPVPTYFNVYLQGGYFEILLRFLESACFIVGQRKRESGECETTKLADSPSTQEEAAPETDELSVRSLPSPEQLQALFRRMFSSHLLGTGTPTGGGGSEAQSTRFPHMQLCHISYLIQTVGVCILIAMLCWSQLESVIPQKENTRKKSKKKQPQQKTTHSHALPADSGDASELVLVGQFRDIVDVLRQAPRSISRLIDDLNLILETAEFSSLLINDKDGEQEEIDCAKKDIWRNLKASYEKSLQGMDKVVNHQISLVSNLHKSTNSDT